MSSRLPHSVGIRPMPRVWFRGEFVLCDRVRCRGEDCTYPHSVQELAAWNAEKFSSSLETGLPTDFERGNWHNRHNYAAKETEFLARVDEPLEIKDIQKDLTRGNYKEKLHKLLCWEEKAHIEILEKKCNGQYTLVLHQAGSKPPWMKKEANRLHKRFGYILGLNGDQIAYATQASEGACIVHDGEEARADILMENYYHVEERMYIAFNRKNLEKLESLSLHKRKFKSQMKLKVEVEFELKHSYFNKLHKAVRHVPPEVIARIVPQARDFHFNQGLQVPDLDMYEQHCSEDQLRALKAVASCPSNGPPFLIAGAFGTGKTHILAVIAHYLFDESKKISQPARVLVCTQQRVSADTFLECYLKPMRPQEEEVYLIREYGFKNPDLKNWYRTVAQFRSYMERSSYRNRTNFLIVTTCLTSLQLTNIIPQGYFTHILLDEGAQTREPEAVAPLSMAGRNTKIVIAGDQNQVGPAMLVLGDEARENGLAVSLLERLHGLYEKLREAARNHCVNLVTNYRCHPGILELAEKLFYKLPLNCKIPKSSAHPDAPYPLLFFCSSIDDKAQSNTNKQEAEITLKLVAKFAKQWPTERWGRLDLSQMCFMSPTRSQLTVANQLIRPLKLYQLQKVRRLPTYDVQGHEFRALFLSTSEPTDEDGTTCNPTKSICDRYVFNTVITRAQSLVVTVGNPFMLLRMEKHMVQKYGEKGKCWSNYIKFCLDNHTFDFHDSVRVSEAEKSKCIQELRNLVEEHLGMSQCKPKHVTMASPHQPLPGEQPTQSLRRLSTPPTDPPSPANFPSPPILPSGRSSSEHTGVVSSPSQKANMQVEKEEASPSDVQGSSHTSTLENDYVMEKCLGKGGFGVVYHVKRKFDSADYAIKIIKLLGKEADQEKKVKREVLALAQLDHQNIVRYYTSWIENAPPGWSDKELWAALKSSESIPSAEQPLYPTPLVRDDSSALTTSSSASAPSNSSETSVGGVVAESSTTDSLIEFIEDEKESRGDKPPNEATKMTAAATAADPVIPLFPEPPTCLVIQTELCREETLHHWLRKNIRNRHRKTVFNYFSQILEAVVYIHKKGFIHRDLKPSNIFFSCEDDTLKVGDFGLVTGNVAANAPSMNPPRPEGQSCSNVAGSPFYTSPEQRAGLPIQRNQAQKIDMFAVGVIFFELCCPFTTEMERHKVLKNLENLENPKFPPRFIDKLHIEADLIRKLLVPEPSHRPTAEHVQKCEQTKRLRKIAKKSHDYIPVL